MIKGWGFIRRCWCRQGLQAGVLQHERKPGLSTSRVFSLVTVRNLGEIVDLYFVFFLVECSPNIKVKNYVFYCYSGARSKGQFTSHHTKTKLPQKLSPLQWEAKQNRGILSMNTHTHNSFRSKLFDHRRKK